MGSATYKTRNEEQPCTKKVSPLLATFMYRSTEADRTVFMATAHTS